MSQNLEGSVFLEGLLEGKLSQDSLSDETIREYLQSLEEVGLRFHLERSDGTASLLPDAGPMSTEKLGTQPDQVIRQAIERLLNILPETDRRKLFCTLRSREYRPHEEVQTLYVIRSDSTVETKTQVAEANTTPKPKPIPPKDIVRYGLLGLVAVAAILGVLSLFVDLRGLWSQAVDRIRPVATDEIEVVVSDFEGLLSVEKKQYDSVSKVLVVTLKRTKAFRHLHWIDSKPQVAVQRCGRIRRCWPVTHSSLRRVLWLWDKLRHSVARLIHREGI